MRLSIIFSFLMMTTVSLFGQHTRQVDVPPFKRVAVSSDIDLFLTPSSHNALEIRGESSVISKVECRVEGDQLNIFLVGTFRWVKNRKVEVYLNYKELEYIAASAGSDVRCDSVMRTHSLEIRGQSGSDIAVNVDVKRLKVTLSSGSDALLKGEADELIVTASSGSSLRAYKLQSRRAVVTTSSGSDANINVTSEVIINASSGSDVRYKGSPAIKEITSSGGSDVFRQ